MAKEAQRPEIVARMPAQTTEAEQVFEQAEDERGRIRLDRPFSAAEAAAQDQANSIAAAEERRLRFATVEERRASRQRLRGA